MTAIEVVDVDKSYPALSPLRPATLKEAVLHGGWRRRGERFVALRQVRLAVPAGRTTGLIGPNGAGKSTLLRLLAGVGRPDRGTIRVHGRVAALFELGGEFHPDLTGRENVTVAGVVAGLHRSQVRALLPQVVAFAELERFVDAPLRTYSSGMQARLAFAVAAHVHPEILLVDEVLAVGDIAFQERCLHRLRELRAAGATIVLVSHDPGLVTGLCDEVVWLRAGRVVEQGPAAEVVARYRTAMNEQTRATTPRDLPVARTPGGVELRAHDNRFGTQDAQVLRCEVLDGWGAECRSVASGAAVQLRVGFRLGPAVPAAELAVTLHRSDGLLCLDTATSVGAGTGAAVVRVERLDLAPGEYAFDVALYSAGWEQTLDLHWRAYPLHVDGPPRGVAGPVLAPPARWTLTG